ncbi:hypothetical protein B0H10DRAFT_1026090 [Mycena sp. CBHHK59/15]|nr:hypothetical protein B0H10DRAFT_1026090 [Mycena sp. CBHHK59/15]
MRIRRSSTVTSNNARLQINTKADQNTPVLSSPMPAKNIDFDNVLDRLHKLSVVTATAAEPRSPLSPYSLGAPFSLSSTRSFDKANANCHFAPRPPPAFDLSPQSSTSSGSELSSASHDAFDAFVATQSRVVRVRFSAPILFQAPADHVAAVQSAACGRRFSRVCLSPAECQPISICSRILPSHIYCRAWSPRRCGCSVRR